MEEKYISMADAARLCSYEQDYLSLLARRGEMKAEKKGRNWFTKVEWLNEYLNAKRPNEIVTKRKLFEVKRETVEAAFVPEKVHRKINKIWILAVAVLVVAFLMFGYIFNKIGSLEKQSQENVFIPEEITKVPNENGGYDVYGEGKVRMGEEGRP